MAEQLTTDEFITQLKERLAESEREHQQWKERAETLHHAIVSGNTESAKQGLDPETEAILKHKREADLEAARKHEQKRAEQDSLYTRYEQFHSKTAQIRSAKNNLSPRLGVNGRAVPEGMLDRQEFFDAVEDLRSLVGRGIDSKKAADLYQRSGSAFQFLKELGEERGLYGLKR